jgi:hypothetical protein
MGIKPQTARAEAKWSSSRFPHYGSSRNRCGKRSGECFPLSIRGSLRFAGKPGVTPKQGEGGRMPPSRPVR